MVRVLGATCASFPRRGGPLAREDRARVCENDPRTDGPEAGNTVLCDDPGSMSCPRESFNRPVPYTHHAVVLPSPGASNRPARGNLGRHGPKSIFRSSDAAAAFARPSRRRRPAERRHRVAPARGRARRASAACARVARAARGSPAHAERAAAKRGQGRGDVAAARACSQSRRGRARCSSRPRCTIGAAPAEPACRARPRHRPE